MQLGTPGRALLGCLGLAVPLGCAEDPITPDPTDSSLPQVSPEEVGWSTDKLLDAEQFAEQSGYAAVVAVRDGRMFFSWGEIDRDFLCHSIRKPLLGALIGIHVGRGEIDLGATMEDLGIDDIPPSLTPQEKQASVRHLIQSRSGVYHEAAAESDLMIATRPVRGSHAPGTFFYYNNWDFNAAGTVFEQQTGLGIFEAFASEIATPLGMQDFDEQKCFYQYEPLKSEHPAYHFRMSARDLARFGVLVQRNGLWNGQQLVPSQWIQESTQAWSVEDPVSGISYGYMWRIAPIGSAVADQVGFPLFYHTGVGVQALVIIPDLDLVIVELYDTDGNWTDPGEVGLQLGLMILDARITE
jgi:CubicO group peptidase (beta-lactamase class C family)